MLLARKSISMVVALLVLALAGLLVVQALLLKYAIELKDQAFSRNVFTALSTVVQQVEAAEIADGVVDVFVTQQPAARWFGTVPPDSCPDGLRKLIALEFDTDRLRTVAKPDDFQIVKFESEAEHLEHAADGLQAHEALTIVVQSERQHMARKVIGDLTRLTKRPIRQRVRTGHIDSLLTANFDEVGIDVAFDYGVIAARNDSLHLTNDERHSTRLRDSRFRTRLFPLDLAPPFFDLAVFFPASRLFVYKQLWPLLLCSVVFTLVIIACFAHTIRTIFAQRRLADRMVGFVNNMTHEFKTPISTVALASEAIARPDVLAHEGTLLRYNRMIREENDRMHQQVDRILQMAQLERGDYELNLVRVDLHELVDEVSARFALQVEQRRGSLVHRREATAAEVIADPMHLANVIQNLLDNAVKYSVAAPDIQLRTWNERDGLVLQVADRGIGIGEHDRKRVFDKYYRCPTGNVHDVKGFGLGLSYVKLMVVALGGDVSIRSRTGWGTLVDVYLPGAVAPTASTEGAETPRSGGQKSGGQNSGEQNSGEQEPT